MKIKHHTSKQPKKKSHGKLDIILRQKRNKNTIPQKLGDSTKIELRGKFIDTNTYTTEK